MFGPITIPFGAKMLFNTVKLKPGGYHIMLMELANPLKKGRTFKVTLEFESGKNQTVKATVKDTAASSSSSGSM